MKLYRTTETGYRFNKLIFFGVFLSIVGLVLMVMYQNNFDFSTHPYFKCKGVFENCQNPFYKDIILQEGQLKDCSQQLNVLWVIPIYKTKDCRDTCDWCKEKTLPPGEYGTKPKYSFLMNNMFMISVLLLAVGLLLNHFIHNKGKKFDIEVPITDKIIINRRTLKEWRDRNEKDENNKQD